MANLTQKEKVLTKLAKIIKQIDKDSFGFDITGCLKEITTAREDLYDILLLNGYQLESGTYKLVKK